MDRPLSDADIVFTDDAPEHPDHFVCDRATFSGGPPCHPTARLTFVVPYVAYDDGRVEYETIEAVQTCPICEARYVWSNIGDHVRMRRLLANRSVVDVAHDVRAEIRKAIC